MWEIAEAKALMTARVELRERDREQEGIAETIKNELKSVAHIVRDWLRWRFDAYRDCHTKSLTMR